MLTFGDLMKITKERLNSRLVMVVMCMLLESRVTFNHLFWVVFLDLSRVYRIESVTHSCLQKAIGKTCSCCHCKLCRQY